MKNVMLYAYTRFNLGDDLFIKILIERYPDANFYLYAPRKYRNIFDSNTNLKVIPSDYFITRGINYICRKLRVRNPIQNQLAKSCDLSVHIGGSVFIQGDNWKEQIENSKKILREKKPFFLLGANFGPYSNHEFYESYKEIFSRYTDICFRENYSYELFKDLSNVRMADDIVFQMKGNNSHKSEKYIVISVIKPSARKQLASYDNSYYEQIKKIAIQFINRGFSVKLMSFCEKEGDNEAINEIIKLIPEQYEASIEKYFYTINIQEALDVIANCSLIVATRFHAMILGWVYNKSVFPIVYSKKMTNVMDDIGFNGFYCELENIQEVDPETVFNALTLNALDISAIKKTAEKHFEKLDQYLLK